MSVGRIADQSGKVNHNQYKSKRSCMCLHRNDFLNSASHEPPRPETLTYRLGVCFWIWLGHADHRHSFTYPILAWIAYGVYLFIVHKLPLWHKHVTAIRTTRLCNRANRLSDHPQMGWSRRFNIILLIYNLTIVLTNHWSVRLHE